PEDEAGGPAGGPSVSLSFSWSQPTAAAVFRRAGWLWVVFDRPQELDVKLLRQMGGEALSHIEQLPNKHSTYVRMITQPGYNPSLRREGLLWIVDLARQPLRAKTPLAVETIADTTIGNRLYMPITEAGAVLRVGDPESGEIMTVVPVLPVGTGISPGLEFPEVQVLPSAQGLALVARSDAVDVRSSRKGIDVTAPPAGLSVTPENERRLIAAGGNATAAGVFDINAWKRGGPEMYEAGHKAVMSMIAAARPHDRNLARIEAARFFTARGQAAEALGILRVAAVDEPGIAESPEFAGVRGAAEFLMGHYDTAYQDLSHPALASLPEAQFWRGAAQAAMDESAKVSEALQQGYGLLKDYPKELRSRIGEIAVNAAIANADDVDARRVLDLMKGDAATPLEKGRLAYLEGNYAQLTHSNDQAFKRWEEAEQGNSRPHRAKAFRNHTELLLKLGKINRKDAIGRLEKLRFAWRSEDFEVPLLKRLADLQLAEADFPGALRSLRAVLNAYPQNKDATATYQQMGQIFERLY
ncbi:MAG: tetratricopeptide repeat protein, partial [Rhodospirillales bacterium]|nr:tetratricopeptide repeat protein [Rhodospirillales bacterium]